MQPSPRLVRSILALPALLALLWSPAVRAVTLTTFSNRASWEAAAVSFVTEDFETTPLGMIPCNSLTPCAGVTISTPLLDLVIDGDNHGNFGIQEPGLVNGTREFRGDVHGPLSIVTPGPLFNLIELSGRVTTFAASLADLFDNSAFPMNVGILGEVLPLPAGTTFFGVTSDTPFTTIELTADPDEGVNFFYSMDDVSFTPIPEPSTAVLLAFGLSGLATRGRARRPGPR